LTVAQTAGLRRLDCCRFDACNLSPVDARELSLTISDALVLKVGSSPQKTRKMFDYQLVIGDPANPALTL